MGRTLPTANMAALLEEERWRDYRRALRREDQDVFDQLWGAAKRHMQASQNAGTLVPFHAILLSMLLETRKDCDALRAEIDALRGELAARQRHPRPKQDARDERGAP